MNDTKSVEELFYCIECIEIFEADKKVCIKKTLKLQSDLR